MDLYFKIPTTKLVSFSREHLYYEIDMLYGVSKVLWRGVKDPYLYNALLESLVIHASIIVDFFYKPAMKPDDAKAAHYMSDIKKWKEVLPPVNRHFRQFNKKRNKRVVHLSYNRLEVKPEDRKWDSPILTREIKKIVDLFLAHADPQRIDPQMYKLKDVSLEIK